eukprot:TRINITY_DN8219_c0_g1_i1.p1 TRINITY_DN8219_c0_g1~~TRINITY_DN8219_c0_g1_i1.p1  ORF type:complete len:374 (+),score=72.53 TRINITY_DN8219_c0_g1_i1:30-1151(+)
MKRFDAYPKAIDDFRIRTNAGGIVSIICGVILFWLFVSEFYLYLSSDVTPVLVVDSERNEKIRINFDITFPKMPCDFISLDAMDVSGEHQVDIEHNVFKTRLDSKGNKIQVGSKTSKSGLAREEASVDMTQKLPPDYCGSCYGAEARAGDCCNSCDDVRNAYRNKGWAFTNPSGIEQCVRDGLMDKLRAMRDEGCQLYGYLSVNKISGNFHFAPGRSLQQNHMHGHDMTIYKFGDGFDLSHKITQLSFGANFPGIQNPLDGVEKKWEEKESPLYEYYLKVVPTTYESDGNIKTNQFSVTEYERAYPQSPAVVFNYDITPIRIVYTTRQTSFTHFLTGICAIIGGIFTVTGILDAFIFQSLRSVEAKIELGKME